MKIQKVRINKYKAFQKSETILIGGKHTFIYGENGSGKSSFFYALKDFFQSSIENIDMTTLRNFTLTDGQNDCSIEVEFDAEAKYILNESTKTTNVSSISDANRMKSFLTYKHLLAVHNIKIGKKIDVFELVVNGVLKHFKSTLITGDEELGKLWENLVKEHEKPFGKGKEFYYARQKKASVERKMIAFNDAINRLFLKGKPDYLGVDVNKILKQFFPDLTVEFQRVNSRVNQWGEITPSELLLNVTSNGIALDNRNPQFALNEAKLSAIAISIFLAAILKQASFSADIKTLFLDDILIGLDNENRLKLLELLLEKDVPDEEKRFKNFQFFITTYDRHWYEIAKLNLKDWTFIEFYKSDEGPAIIQKHQTNFEKAKAYFKAYNFPMSGNYLRKACERILKEKLIETYKNSEVINDQLKPPNLNTLITRLKMYYNDLGLQAPDKLVETLQTYRSVLLNPMSHSDLESPIYRMDIEKTIKAIEDLKDIKLPVRKILIDKGSLFTLSLSDIDYTASLELAENVYKVENEGVKSISPIEVYFKKWTRAGVDFAKPTGTSAYPNNERLDKIKESPFTLEKAIGGLNVSYKDQGLAEIDVAHLKTNIVREGEKLSDILSSVL